MNRNEKWHNLYPDSLNRLFHHANLISNYPDSLYNFIMPFRSYLENSYSFGEAADCKHSTQGTRTAKTKCGRYVTQTYSDVHLSISTKRWRYEEDRKKKPLTLRAEAGACRSSVQPLPERNLFRTLKYSLALVRKMSEFWCRGIVQNLKF